MEKTEICTCIAVTTYVPEDAPLEARIPSTKIIHCGVHTQVAGERERLLEALRAADKMAEEAIDLSHNRECSCNRPSVRAAAGLVTPCARCEVSFESTVKAVGRYRLARAALAGSAEQGGR